MGCYTILLYPRYLCEYLQCKITTNKHAILSSHEIVSSPMVNSYRKHSLAVFNFPCFLTRNTSSVTQIASLKSMTNNSNLFTIKNSALPKNKVFFGILKYLFAYYSDDSKFIVPLDSNFFLIASK